MKVRSALCLWVSGSLGGTLCSSPWLGLGLELPGSLAMGSWGACVCGITVSRHMLVFLVQRKDQDPC